jgi:hypothetical protein
MAIPYLLYFNPVTHISMRNLTLILDMLTVVYFTQDRIPDLSTGKCLRIPILEKHGGKD